MDERRNILVMGGSFNPPTIAHLRLIQAAMDALNAERGYLAPVSHAYLKRKMVRAGSGHLCIPTGTRLEMLRAMIREDPRLRVYEGEINEPFAVTPRTMEAIQERHPDERIWFVAGEDKLELLETLTRKWDFLPRFNAVVFARGGDLERDIAASGVLAPFREAIAVIEPPAGIGGVSSTAVRRHLFDADAVADMLHPAVLPLLKRLRAEDYPREIVAFKDGRAWLGNDYPAPIAYEGVEYTSAEAAFQASKSDDPEERRRFSRMNPEKARQRGSQLIPGPAWEAAKDEIMAEILLLKFRQNLILKRRLLATGNYRLINGGKGKKDTYWGVNTITWKGENRLGVLLMKVRDDLRRENEDCVK